jgi:hypothetical protein
MLYHHTRGVIFGLILFSSIKYVLRFWVFLILCLPCFLGLGLSRPCALLFQGALYIKPTVWSLFVGGIYLFALADLWFYLKKALCDCCLLSRGIWDMCFMSLFFSFSLKRGHVHEYRLWYWTMVAECHFGGYYNRISRVQKHFGHSTK